MKLAFGDPTLDDQFKRSAAAAYCGAADLGELLVAARHPRRRGCALGTDRRRRPTDGGDAPGAARPAAPAGDARAAHVDTGATTVGDFIRKQAAFTLEGLAERIRCPTLVVDCESDFASRSDRLFAALTCSKTIVKLGADSGTGGHCGGLGQQVWASAVFPWIAAAIRWRE